EHVMRLPEVVDALFLNAPDHQGPAHHLDHVAMHVVGGQRDVGTGTTQPAGGGDAPALRVAARHVGNVDARPADAFEIAVRHVHTVRGGIAVVEQADVLDELGRRHAVAFLHAGVFLAALRQVAV